MVTHFWSPLIYLGLNFCFLGGNDQKTHDKSDPMNKTGKTPLHLAGQLGHFEICELILKNAVDRNTRNRKDERS